MAKKSAGINLGLGANELNRLSRASQATAGVGQFKTKGLGETLGQAAVDRGAEMMEEAAEEKEALEKEQQEEKNRLEGNLQTKLDEFINAGSNTNEYNFGFDKLQGIRDQILESTDDKERADLTREFNMYIADIKTQTASDVESATGLKGFSMDPNNNESKAVSSATDQRTVSLLEKFYAGESQISTNEKGEKVYTIEVPSPAGSAGPPDVFTGTRAELEDMVVPKASEFDLAIGSMATAVKSNAESGGFFNEQDVRRQIGNNLNSKDFKALFKDNLESTGKSVMDDISSEIDNLTYQELLSPEELNEFNISPDEGETNWHDNISPQDKEFMLKKIQEDENVGRSVLENYFFRFVKQQHKTTLEGTNQARKTQAGVEGQINSIEDSSAAGGNNRLAKS